MRARPVTAVIHTLSARTALRPDVRARLVRAIGRSGTSGLDPQHPAAAHTHVRQVHVIAQAHMLARLHRTWLVRIRPPRLAQLVAPDHRAPFLCLIHA
jgi:hypothetical protein